ncbi:GNAT family N-acetyltransferase [Chloroflexota bacterium]
MTKEVEIVPVDASNLAEYGFFCYKSKPKSEGYRRKMAWLEGRFQEGLKLRIIHEEGRSVGFVEYIPGEYAWRAVKARNYMVIHCLWVVGRAKKKGYGSRLLKECVGDARQQGMDGVVAVTSSGTWLVDSKLFFKHGFELVNTAPPSFELLVKRFGNAPLPSFPQDWEQRASRHGSGLTVFRSDQCPYIEDATKGVLDLAAELGLEARVVEVKDYHQAQDTSPSPYGVFNIVYKGQLATYTYIGSREKKALIGLVEGQSNTSAGCTGSEVPRVQHVDLATARR